MKKFMFFLKSKFPVFMFWCGKKKCILSTFFYRKHPEKWTIKKYEKKYGTKLDIDNPSSFYEKMNCLKHFYHDDLDTLYSDKLRVKEVVDNSGILIPKVYYSTNNVKDLKQWINNNRESVKQFVIKTNHSCGDIFIYRNGIVTRKYGIVIKNINKVYRMLKIALKYNHYYTCFERNYKDIKPLVFVEEYIDMDNAIEYEFMTNYGQIRFTNVVFDRQSSRKVEALVDTNWNVLDKNSSQSIVKPKHLDAMQAFITKFASKFPFCRVDFIDNDNSVYFCEFTFVKSGGIGTLGFKELDDDLGKLIDITPVMKEKRC